MENFITMDQIEEAAGVVRQQVTTSPRVGMILGSGLSSLADAVEAEATIPYGDIPYFPVSTVAGHAGRLVAGRLEDQPVMVMQGRAHYYEGYSMGRIALPVRVLQSMGAEVLVVTNAAGGINARFSPGEIMLIRDHINLIGMAGLNPLRGPNLEQFGPRFPDMSQAYDPQLRAQAQSVAEEEDIPYHEGVYIALAGPSFETPADVQFLRLIGADAVGMSTVPEVIAARHGGMRVLGISGISNVIAPELEEIAGATSHEEVLEAGRIIVPRMERVIRGVLRRL